MKRTLLLLIVLVGSQFSTVPASAVESKIIRLVTEPNRNFAGYFYNDQLSHRLSPNGDLGRLVFSQIKAPRTWVIDTALIDDISAMTGGYQIGLIDGEKQDGVGSEVAANWLIQFAKISSLDNVLVLPYGNPNYRLMKIYAPGELNFYYAVANQRLSELLKRKVISDKFGSFSAGSIKSNDALRVAYSQNRRTVTTLDRVVDAPELTTLRVQLARLLTSNIDQKFRDRLVKSANQEVLRSSRKLKVVSGRYRLTSTNVELPVTLVNKFSTPALVSLELLPRNSRIQLAGIKNINIPADSKMQLPLSVNVVTPGTVTVAARLTDNKGVAVSKYSKLALNLSIVDARVAWFTSSAALLLFIAASAQTIRRVRKSRK